MVWTELILTFFGIIVVTGTFIGAIILNKSIVKVRVTPNMPLIENDYRKEFTNGYTLGTLKSITKCKNGTNRIEFYPMDVEQGEEIARPTVQTYIVKEEYVIPFAVGELSDRRQRIKTTTRNPLLIPKKMQDTIDADYETKEGQLSYLRSEVGKMIPAGDEAITEFLKGTTRVGMTKLAFAELKERAKKQAEIGAISRGEEEKPDKK